MQQRTSKLLYSYWNEVRHDRLAPRRFEIEPAKIAGLLPETFIVECGGLSGYRYRLAGTRICEQFGQELRGSDLLHIWEDHDREAARTLLLSVIHDGAVGVLTTTGYTEDGRACTFEILLLPLIHTGTSINRMLGSISAVEPPYWLGASALVRHELGKLNVVWPEGHPHFQNRPREPLTLIRTGTPIGGRPRPRFRVYDGGLADR